MEPAPAPAGFRPRRHDLLHDDEVLAFLWVVHHRIWLLNPLFKLLTYIAAGGTVWVVLVVPTCLADPVIATVQRTRFRDRLARPRRIGTA